MGLWQLFKVGGITMYVLLLCSVISSAVIIERCFYYYRRSRLTRNSFMAAIAKALRKDDFKSAQDLCAAQDSPLASVVNSGLTLRGYGANIVSNSMERSIAIETNKLERYTSIVATIGSTAVYIGLFGTVLGIIRTFHDISVNSSGGINVVINGISEALVCTAAGLVVAVPAVIAYNYFTKRVDNFVTEMELCASETLDLLSVGEKS